MERIVHGASAGRAVSLGFGSRWFESLGLPDLVLAGDDVEALAVVTLAMGPSLVAQTKPTVGFGCFPATWTCDGCPRVVPTEVEAIGQSDAVTAWAFEPETSASLRGGVGLLGDPLRGKRRGLWDGWQQMPPAFPWEFSPPLDFEDGG